MVLISRFALTLFVAIAVGLVREDGSSEMQALSEDAEHFYKEPAWSADGKTILFTRTKQKDSQAPPEAWKYDLETQCFDSIKVNGENARWLP